MAAIPTRAPVHGTHVPAICKDEVLPKLKVQGFSPPILDLSGNPPFAGEFLSVGKPPLAEDEAKLSR